jgi:hypothetical protein
MGKAIKLALSLFNDGDDDKLEQVDIAKKEYNMVLSYNHFHPGLVLMYSELLYIEKKYMEAINNSLSLPMGQVPILTKSIHLHLGKCYVEIMDNESALQSFGIAMDNLEESDNNNRITALLGCSRCFFNWVNTIKR